MEPSTTGSGPSLADLSSDWLDLYTILNVAPDADAETVRRRISMRTSEAVGNSNHRDSKRREYYQTLSQQVLPQSRRVLLDPTFRSAYDQQRELHLSGGSGALTFKAFLGTLNEGGVPSAATSGSEPIAVAVAAPAVPEVERFPVAAPAVAADIEAAPVHAARAPVPAAEAVDTAADEEDDTPVMPIIPKDRSLLTPIGDPAGDKPAPRKKVPPKVAASPAARLAPKPAVRDNAGPRPGADSSEFVQKQRRVSYSYAPRVVVDDEAARTKGLFRPGERALSDTSIALLTAIVATMLSITIDLYSEPGNFVLSATILFMLPRLRLKAPQ